ncbi:MAG: superoxide dismutase [Phycisphaerae bacterium]|nr:superoxide dismutase [Phycisphaerae bacterium]
MAGSFAGSRAALSADQLGWDESKSEYTLPPLPYEPGALEPHIDEQTMSIHHDKHHAGYVKGLNKALGELEGIRTGSADPGLIKHWSRELAFNGSGHVNHTLFWTGMAPSSDGGGGRPGGALGERIDQDFGSFSQFVAHFKGASKAVEGSGWGWLVYEPIARRLMVIQMEKHQDLTVSGVSPLLGIDVWEHAYYLKYQNKRADYVDAFMNVVNWPEIERRFGMYTGH